MIVTKNADPHDDSEQPEKKESLARGMSEEFMKSAAGKAGEATVDYEVSNGQQQLDDVKVAAFIFVVSSHASSSRISNHRDYGQNIVGVSRNLKGGALSMMSRRRIECRRARFGRDCPVY